ncbi:MAG: hypothetical protein IJN10_03660 [Firmicutes bacterium]|nr:hypothetical protein [Bacillota bacterium]
MNCGRPLTADEVAVHRKLVSRESSKFMCKTCLASYFNVPEEKIDQKIIQFKRQGCLLFAHELTTGDTHI